MYCKITYKYYYIYREDIFTENVILVIKCKIKLENKHFELFIKNLFINRKYYVRAIVCKNHTDSEVIVAKCTHFPKYQC